MLSNVSSKIVPFVR